MSNDSRALEADLAHAMQGEVCFDPYSRILYSTDASIYQIEPLGVVFPRDRDDVQAAVEITRRYRVPLVPRGGGSSLAGQAIGPGLVIDFNRHMHHIIDIDPEAGWVRAEPGVVCDQLNAALRPHGLMFAPDPASSNRATVGGMLGNNAAGAHSLRYGMTADHVLEVDAFLADGTSVRLGPQAPDELATLRTGVGRLGQIYRGLARLVEQHETDIRKRFPRTWRRASGYSLNYLIPPHGFTATRPSGWPADKPYPRAHGFNPAQLLAGSEGTLAIVTEARLNCTPRPACTGLSVLSFDSVVAATEATPAILETDPAAVELIDAVLIRLTRAMPAFARQLTFVHGDPAALLVVEHVGDIDQDVTAHMDRLEAHLRRSGIRLSAPIDRAQTAQSQASVWAVRRVGLGLLNSLRSPLKPAAFMEDVAVPVEHLGRYVRAIEALFAQHGTHASIYAHASAGCLHIRPVLDLKTVAGVAAMRALAEAVLEIVISLGGAMSGEHGDGLSRSAWNRRLFGDTLYDLFGAVKDLFDPDRRLNPGKVVGGPEMTSNLRYGPAYRATDIDTHLSFSREGGFTAAVEQCNGAGVCLKADGTMCPSYMATRDEEHSTRGRANALRAALSGRLHPAELTSRRMHAVLDLCIECKACKAECPSGVDMAKIKYEWLAQYHAAHGTPLRARLFGHVHRLWQLSQPFSPLVNRVASLGTVRRATGHLLGIAAERRLPTLSRQTFRQQARAKQGLGDDRRRIALFADTFTNFSEPHIGLAALKVLESAGFDVVVPDHTCCGRTMLSKGLLNDARQAAQRNISALAPLAARGIPILGLEPSCLLTLRDEYPDLLPGNEDARLVASHTHLIEEFLVALAAQGQLQLQWNRRNDQNILLHPHCHQSALAGTGPIVESLQLPGWQVQLTNAGCCGLAGSFGYEAEHYALSMTIGEGRLFPAVRSTGADVLLAASGTSCRQQIAHGTGRQAQHPIELLADALA
jgi:FAD/FMN-containing dehydrogenase/Fe-S oxidoreductase